MFSILSLWILATQLTCIVSFIQQGRASKKIARYNTCLMTFYDTQDRLRYNRRMREVRANTPIVATSSSTATATQNLFAPTKGKRARPKTKANSESVTVNKMSDMQLLDSSFYDETREG